MRMKPAPPDFSRLQKLLAVKRHEQPPPGYLDRLPGQITARLRAEAAAAPEPWWRQLLASFHTKPAWAIAFSFLALGALTTGILLAPGLQKETDPEANTGAAGSAATVAAGETIPASNHVALQLPLDGATNLSNSAAPPGLFSPSGQVDRVKFK